MEKKKRITNKPKQVKLPSTIYLIQDIFCDYDGCWTSIIGFEYSQEKAEKIRETRAKTMEDGFNKREAIYAKYRLSMDAEEQEKLWSDMEQYNGFENYSRTEVKEITIAK